MCLQEASRIYNGKGGKRQFTGFCKLGELWSGILRAEIRVGALVLRKWGREIVDLEQNQSRQEQRNLTFIWDQVGPKLGIHGQKQS